MRVTLLLVFIVSVAVMATEEMGSPAQPPGRLLETADTPTSGPGLDDSDPSALIGTWRGTSTCSDRVAAPACRDEIVVYEFTPGSAPGVVHWKADKVVNGEREAMGEMDLRYDGEKKCWSVDYEARVTWCLSIAGDHMTGTGKLIPGGEVVRKVDARKQRS